MRGSSGTESAILRPFTGLVYQPWIIDDDDDDDCGALDGMNEWQGKRKYSREKPAPVLLWPPQIPHMTYPSLKPRPP
jgi:hypothetical protein